VTTRRAAPDPNDGLGLALAAGSAAVLGLAVAVSRLAYEGGTNGLTVATCRSLTAAVGMLAFCVLTRRSVRVGLGDWAHCAGLGMLMSMMLYGNVGSVQYIPVGLAALLFYTFPPMVAVIQALVLRDPPGWAKSAAVAVAFAGLAVMLGVSVAGVDLRGVALALAAALATAWHSVWLVRRLAHLDAMVATFHMTAMAAALLVLLAWSHGDVREPATVLGWVGLVGVVLLQSSGLPLYIAAVRRVGPMKCSMVANVQPVTSIVAALVLYGEVLGTTQLLGGALVIAGIVLMQRQDASRAAGAR
jgi:DME family drug/metabolite transporter